MPCKLCSHPLFKEETGEMCVFCRQKAVDRWFLIAGFLGRLGRVIIDVSAKSEREFDLEFKEKEKMLRTLGTAILLVLFASVAQAQGAQFAWTASPNAATAAEAQGLTHTIYVNNAVAGSGVVLTGVTCTGTAPNIGCLATIPATITQAIGTRYEITAKTATSLESPRSLPFIKAPDAPTNLRTQ